MQPPQKIIDGLIKAYWMELETIQNYLANSVNLDGIRAEEVKKALAADITAELGHASRVATRIKTIGGKVPGSLGFIAAQTSLQPPADNRNVAAVIRGVIDAEEAAITQYKSLIRICDGEDYVTQDLCIQLLGDEEAHLREFLGYLTEYEGV